MNSRRRSRLSLDLLQGFEAAARHLSFTRAAQELSLTQSAISREIKTLEEQLGQPLFIRVNRGLRLTDAGQTLKLAVGQALALVDEATGQLAGSRGTETLTVTTSAPLASTWLVPRLWRFLSVRPHVDVRCVAADQKLDLERERLDVALRWVPPGLMVAGGEPLFEVELFPVCAPALARDRTRSLAAPADLANHVLLDLETFTGKGPWSDWGPWLDAMNMRDLKPTGTLRFSHYDQVVQAAIDGSGIAIGRKPHNMRHLRDGLLLAPLGDRARVSFGTYFALVRPRSAKRQVVQEFVNWLRDEIRDEIEPGDVRTRTAEVLTEMGRRSIASSQKPKTR
jgi:LysR family glycine cleavage system transcriptional activator